jgi:hypothetical protein
MLLPPQSVDAMGRGAWGRKRDAATVLLIWRKAGLKK